MNKNHPSQLKFTDNRDLVGDTWRVMRIMAEFIDSFEEMKKLNAELSEIPEEKETYFYSFHPSIFIVRIMKYKRLWKRQKIP